MVRRRVVVHGRVQGVFFRDSVRTAARSADVAGSATNLADGTVEVVLEGEPSSVETVIDFCRRGPARAEVERVEVFDERVEGVQGFRIL